MHQRVCEERDEGLYAMRAGEIQGFTGIDDPYEEPLNPKLFVTPRKKLSRKALPK